MKTREYWLSRKFYDNRRYPFGFSRSGDFSIGQSRLLEDYGMLIKALLLGEVSNPTKEDALLKVSIDNNDMGSADELAKAWLKYSNGKRQIITVSASASEVTIEDDWVDDTEIS